MYFGIYFSGFSQDFRCYVKANKDRRQQIVQQQSAYGMVAYIKMTRNRTVFMGSGCLISPRVLLTAGHNLRFEGEGSRVRLLQIWLGATTENTLTGYQEFVTNQGDNIFTLSSFDNHYTINEDFSIAILPDSSLYKKIGKCFKLTVCDSAFTAGIAGKAINITGYPYDQPEFTMWNDATLNYSYTHWNNIINDTYGVTRLSGSPVWIQQGNDYKVFALHTQGSKNHRACSIATPISSKIYTQIATWCKSKGIDIN
jgi:V8-like Glu-specific endopeptidase